MWEPNCSVRTEGRRHDESNGRLAILQKFLQIVLDIRKGSPETDCAWVNGTRWHRRKPWTLLRNFGTIAHIHTILSPKSWSSLSLKRCKSLKSSERTSSLVSLAPISGSPEYLVSAWHFQELDCQTLTALEPSVIAYIVMSVKLVLTRGRLGFDSWKEGKVRILRFTSMSRPDYLPI
jgi:hypothetical protein